MRSERIEWLDTAKGIGIVYVALNHAATMLPGIFVAYILSFFMPLFFFLSGYTYNSVKHSNIKIFLHKKFNSLLKPYFWYSVILYGIFILVDPFMDHRSLIYYIFKPWLGIAYSREYFLDTLKFNTIHQSPLLFINNGPLWFLTCLFIVSLLFFYIQDIKNYFYIIIILIVSSILGYLLSLFSPLLLPWSIDTAFTCLLFYAAGFYMKKTCFLNKRFQIKYIIFLVFLFLFLNLCSLKFGGALLPNIALRIYGNYIFFYLRGFTGIFTCIFIAQLIGKIKLFTLPLSFLGINSLIFFAFHYVIFYVLEVFYALLFHSPYNSYPLSHGIILILISFLLITFINKLLSLKFTKLFPKLFFNRQI